MEEKENSNILKDWRVWIGILIVVGIIAIIFFLEKIDTNGINTETVKEVIADEDNKITDDDIIELAQTEIKKNLKKPETAKFKLKQLQRKKGQCLVDIYSISEDEDENEGRLEFVVRIEEKNGSLKYIEMRSNNDTCNTDVAEEFEQLMRNCNYEQAYNELFTSNLKKQLKLEEFQNYKINMYAMENVSAKVLADNSVLTSFYDSVNKKSYLVTIKNGMITQLKQI